MEPLTIFGAVLGSLLGKVLPNLVLTASLVIILAFMGHKTLKKGISMWNEESKSVVLHSSLGDIDDMEMLGPDGGGITANISEDGNGADVNYLELQSDNEGLGGARSLVMPRRPAKAPAEGATTSYKIATLTVCFAGACALTVLKGGGNFRSPLGFVCGSTGYWMISCGSLPWVLAFAFYYRHMLVTEFEQKLRSGYSFAADEVQWNAENTVKYPIVCALAGLMAGLFGVGGGIVKGPLMLEMGVMPAVASASAAAMILFTSAAASTSFLVFGLLHHGYGVIFFVLGFVCTAIGQYSVGQCAKRYQRQSPIVLSIGLVITLSSLLVAVNTFASSAGQTVGELLRGHGLCTMEA